MVPIKTEDTPEHLNSKSTTYIFSPKFLLNHNILAPKLMYEPSLKTQGLL